MSAHDVLVVGAGPTGMMLAAELALAGVDVAIVERRTDQAVDSSRAGGLHARTIEVLDQRGIADRFLAAGTAMQVQAFAGIPLDIVDFPTRHPHGLALWQSAFEPILADRVRELGVPVLRGCEAVGLVQDDAGVTVELADGRSLRGAYAVGCDGGRSVIRRAAGIGFAGSDASRSWLIAELAMDVEPPFGLREGGGIGRAATPGLVRLALLEPTVGRAEEPTLDDVRAALVAVDGTDYGARDPSWLSRFTDATRQATRYRAGRVLVAGDAAHVHPPQGGLGLNTGVQDAVNLGWKLAQVVRGTSPAGLLDSYHAERHPVAARVLRTTLAQVALVGGDVRTQALRDVLAGLLAMDGPRREIGALMSGLDIRYDLGEGHPLLGRRMPDLDLETATGPDRVSALLHGAWPVLLDLDAALHDEHAPWADRVRRVEARCAGGWELPVIGAVSPPTAVLIRPDGHVAWVGEGSADGLATALSTWFGPASAP